MDGEEIWTEVGLQEEKILGIDYILCTCVYVFLFACVQMLAFIHRYKLTLGVRTLKFLQ